MKNKEDFMKNHRLIISFSDAQNTRKDNRLNHSSVELIKSVQRGDKDSKTPNKEVYENHESIDKSKLTS